MALITNTRAKEAIPNFPSADETILTNIVAAASDFIERYCARTFASTSYDELYNGTGQRTLFLNNFPVTAVSRVATGLTDVIQVDYTGSGSRALVQVTSTGVTLTSVASGTTTTNSVTFASNTTITALATAISAVSNWTATALSSYGSWASADLKAIQGNYNATSPVNLKVHVTDLGYFDVNADIGELYVPGHFAKGYRNYRVSYTAGFSSVPEPVQQACAEYAAALYKARTINPALQSESLGQYSYTVAARQLFDALPSAKQALSVYRVHRVKPFTI